MWDSWYLPRFLFNGGSLTLMSIVFFMVLVKPCSSLPTMEKLSNVMLCPVVQKWSKMGGVSKVFFVSFTITSACYPYVFHFATWLITSVPVYGFPFLDDVVFVTGATRSSLTMLAPLNWRWTPALSHMFLKLSLSPLEYGITKKVMWFLLLFLCRFVLFCHCFWLH